MNDKKPSNTSMEYEFQKYLQWRSKTHANPTHKIECHGKTAFRVYPRSFGTLIFDKITSHNIYIFGHSDIIIDDLMNKLYNHDTVLMDAYKFSTNVYFFVLMMDEYTIALNSLSINEPENKTFTVLLYGMPGAGKSTIGNCILGNNIFEVNEYSKNSHPFISNIHSYYDNNHNMINVIDTSSLDANIITSSDFVHKLAKVDIVLFIMSGKIDEELIKTYKFLTKTLLRNGEKDVLFIRNQVNNWTSTQPSEIECNLLKKKKSIPSEIIDKISNNKFMLLPFIKDEKDLKNITNIRLSILKYIYEYSINNHML